MNLDHTNETILIVKAALGLKATKTFNSAYVPYCFRWLSNTQWWDKKNDRLNRSALLSTLAEDPYALRKVQGIGEVSERDLFRALLATVGEK